MSDSLTRIQQMHQEIIDAGKKKKELNAVLKEAYEKSKAYHDLNEEMEQLRAKKKQLETAIRQEYASEYNDLEDIKTDIKDTKMVLSDMMWNELMKNNKVEVLDQYENKFVPQVLVTLKKAG
jgi:hypothetical protein